MAAMWRCCFALLLLTACDRTTPGAPIPREGRLRGERPSVLILAANQALPSDLDRQGGLAGDRLVAAGTRMAHAYARFDEAGAARADLMGAEALPGLTDGGDLRARFVAGGYRSVELDLDDLSPLWNGEGPGFAMIEVSGPKPLGAAAQAVASLRAAGVADRVMWAVTAWQGDPQAPAISEQRLAVPLVIGYPGQLAPAEVRPQMVSHADLAATLLDLCGLGLTPGVGAEGQSFARILIKQPHTWRGHVLARRVQPVDGEARAWVRSLKWCLIVGAASGDRLSWIETDPYANSDDLGRPGAASAEAEMRRVLGEWD